jgi:hypothetical protein
MPLPEANQPERENITEENVSNETPQTDNFMNEIRDTVRESIDRSIRYSEYVSESINGLVPDNQNEDLLGNDSDWVYDEPSSDVQERDLGRNRRYTIAELQHNPRARNRYIDQLVGMSNRDLRQMMSSERENPFYAEALKIKSQKRRNQDIDFNEYLALLKPLIQNYQNHGYRINFPNEQMHEYYDAMSHHRVDYDDNGQRAVNYKIPVYGKSFSKLIKNYKMLNKIFRILSSTRHPEFFSGEVNFATCKSDGSIEFLPKNRFVKIEEKLKVDEISGFSETIGRISCKAGKFIQWFLSPKAIEEFGVTQKDIEQFSIILKSGDDYYYKTCKVNVVKGEDVRKYYLEDNYYDMGYSMGTLRGSCMRHERTNSFLDLYAKNPEEISLVVLLKEGKVMARSILWKVYDYGMVMDRIYYTRDTDVEYLKKWAKNNGIICKQHQTSHQCEEFITPNGSAHRYKMCVRVNHMKFETYPYVDTFRYANFTKGLLFNYQDNDAEYVLNSTGGSYGRVSRMSNRQEVETNTSEPTPYYGAAMSMEVPIFEDNGDDVEIGG